MADGKTILVIDDDAEIVTPPGDVAHFAWSREVARRGGRFHVAGGLSLPAPVAGVGAFLAICGV